jgi:hypothetical protein
MNFLFFQAIKLIDLALAAAVAGSQSREDIVWLVTDEGAQHGSARWLD